MESRASKPPTQRRDQRVPRHLSQGARATLSTFSAAGPTAISTGRKRSSQVGERRGPPALLPPKRLNRFGDADPALVERSADDRALDLRAGFGLQPFEVRELAHAAGGDHPGR